MSYWDLLDKDLQEYIIEKSNKINHQDNFKNVLIDIVKNPLNINIFSSKNCYGLLYNAKKMFWSPYEGSRILHKYLLSYEDDLGFIDTISPVQSSSSESDSESESE